MFFVAFLPQFIDPGSPALPQLLLLGATFIVIGITWMTLYGLGVSRLRQLLSSERFRRWLGRITGSVLVAFSARLALDRG